MIEIIRDPMWQFVGVILVIIIPLVLYLVQRRRKALSWEIISNTPLLSIDDAIRGNLQVLFDGKPVQDVQLIIVKIINSGNVEIKSTDYERPINLDFGENARILTAKVIETNPDGIDASTNIEGTKVFLNPTLLNEKDCITIKAMVGQFNGQIAIEGRIVGVKEVQKYTKNKIRDIRILFTLFFTTVMYGMLILASAGLIESMGLFEHTAIAITLSAVILIIVVIFFYKD